jgi:hypothetical protein
MILITPIPLKAPDTLLTEYVGTREELLAEHIATPEMFPAEQKIKAYGGGDTSRDHWIMERIRGGRFRLRMWRPKDYAPAMPTPHRTENEAEFREDAVRLSETLLNMLTQGAPDNPYRYDTQSLQAIRTHAHRLLEAVANGRIVKVTENIKRREVVHLHAKKTEEFDLRNQLLDAPIVLC